MPQTDKSNGYEEIAENFIAGRGQDPSGVGASEVREWAKALPKGATVLDLGCGNGVPIAQVLIERRLNVYGVDAAPKMVAAFRKRFPTVPVECAAVEDSGFFGLTFDAVVAWGLLFLLREDLQRQLIGKVAAVLQTGGKFLFTSPRQKCSWADVQTGRSSVSLGYEAYQEALQAEGLLLVGTTRDAGQNFYYLVQKP